MPIKPVKSHYGDPDLFPIAEAKAQSVYSLGTALPFSIRLMFDCLIPLFSELRVFHIFSRLSQNNSFIILKFGKQYELSDTDNL